MTASFKTILKSDSEEITITKSRFIGYAFPVESEEQAADYIQEIKTRHRDARHNVYAYIIGEKSNIQRYSDDGEPSGTGGIPLINYFKSMGLTNLLVVVTRYFGGIKLGTGGLARAYSKAAKLAVEKSRIVEAREYTCFKISFDYTLIGKIDNYLSNAGLHVAGRDYLEKVDVQLIVEVDRLDTIRTELRDLTSDNIDMEVIYTRHYLSDGESILNL